MDETRGRQLGRRGISPGVRAAVAGVLIAAAALVAWAASRPSGPTTVDVVVAASEVPAGSVLGPADLAVAAIDAPEEILDRMAVDVDDVVGRRAQVALRRGDVVHPGQLDGGADDAPLLEVAVELEPARAVASRLRDGDVVDVLATAADAGDGAAGDGAADGGAPAGARRAAEALIVSVDRPGADGLGVGGVVVTLGVSDPDAAGAIADAAEGGIRLVRRLDRTATR